MIKKTISLSMINDKSPMSVHEIEPVNLQYSLNEDLAIDLEGMISDFAYLSNSSCVFIDYSDNTAPKRADLNDLNLIEQLDDGFKGLLKIYTTDSACTKQEVFELKSSTGARVVCLPVFLTNRIYGFVVYGGYFLDTDDLKDDNTITLKIADLNKYRAIRFTKILSSQLNSTFDLKEKIKENIKATEELNLQKSFFENLFENSPNAIVILDNKDRVIKINREFERLFEYTREEADSKLINDLIVPENFKSEGEGATKDAAEGKIIELTTIRQTKSGKQIHVEVSGKPVLLGDNQVAVHAIYRNLSEQVWNQKRQQIMLEISEILNSASTSIEMIHKIGDQLAPIIGSGQLFLDLISPNKKGFRSFQQGENDYKKIQFRESLSYAVLKEKEVCCIVDDKVEETVSLNKLKISTCPKMWLGFPLIDKGLILGVFGVCSLKNSTKLNKESLELLEVLSKQLAAGVIKKKSELELKMLHGSMEQSPASIIITDLNGDIEYVNPKFCSISGYSSQELIGKNPRILKSGFTPNEVYEKMWATISKGNEWTGEFLNVRKNKELYWERASITAINDEFGNITHYLAIKEDISKSKKFEKDLLEAKNKAEESDRLKTAFLANMSHELRTPLNAVIGFSNLCNDSMSIGELMEFVNLINRSGNQLLGIIEDILSFTLIDGGGMRLVEEEFLMINFLEEIKKQAREKQIQKNKERLKLRFSPDPNYNRILVKTDFQRLLQVVLNLFGNGLKFTNEGFVEFGYRLLGDQIKLYIKDSGVGIEKEKKDVIFDRFRQADDSITRTFGGTGMGLAISKKIVDMLGGIIEVESDKNEGSTFSVVLNCVISKTEKTVNKMYDEKDEVKVEKTILVAEDESSNYRLIQAILKRNNFKVIRAENGEEAMNMCAEDASIDLVLMDIRMPLMNGMEATKEIKKIRPNLPIIAQTAYAMDGDKDKAIEQGFDDYVSKPIRKDILIEKIKLFLKL